MAVNQTSSPEDVFEAPRLMKSLSSKHRQAGGALLPRVGAQHSHAAVEAVPAQPLRFRLNVTAHSGPR